MEPNGSQVSCWRQDCCAPEVAPLPSSFPPSASQQDRGELITNGGVGAGCQPALVFAVGSCSSESYLAFSAWLFLEYWLFRIPWDTLMLKHFHGLVRILGILAGCDLV